MIDLLQASDDLARIGSQIDAIHIFGGRQA